MQRSCLFICSVLGTHPISCAICVSVAICINFHRKKKKKKEKKTKILVGPRGTKMPFVRLHIIIKHVCINKQADTEMSSNSLESRFACNY